MRLRSFRLVLLVVIVVFLYFVVVQNIVSDVVDVANSNLEQYAEMEQQTQQQKPGRFDPDAPKTVIFLTYQRSGSSFIGHIFNYNPTAFYLFEPLDLLYVTMYAINHGWSVPSDIFNYWNGSERILPEAEVVGVAEFLRHLLSCDIDWMPTEALTHNFWWIHRHNTLNVDDYVSCVHGRNLTYPACQQHNRWPCGQRFGAVDESRHADCRRVLWQRRYPKFSDVTSGRKIDVGDYERCLSQLRSDVDISCTHLLKSACTSRPLRIAKVTRATMSSVEHLLRTSSDPNLRIIHSLRDPRAVALSRKTQGDPLLGKFASVMLYDNPDETIVREARMYCRTAAADVRLRRRLETTFPGRIHTVRYEDVAGDLPSHVDELYRFIGERGAPAETLAWAAKNAEKSRRTASAWRANMTVALSDRVLAECIELCQLIGCP